MGHYPPMKNVIYAMRDPHPQNYEQEEVAPHTLCAAQTIPRPEFYPLPPCLFYTTTLLLSFTPTPPGAKNLGQSKKIFAKI